MFGSGPDDSGGMEYNLHIYIRIWLFEQNLLDIGDMMEQCVPVYIHLWDAIHGRKSLLFDWNTGFGNNMVGVVLHFGLISPFNIIFYSLNVRRLKHLCQSIY